MAEAESEVVAEVDSQVALVAVDGLFVQRPYVLCWQQPDKEWRKFVLPRFQLWDLVNEAVSADDILSSGFKTGW